MEEFVAVDELKTDALSDLSDFTSISRSAYFSIGTTFGSVGDSFKEIALFNELWLLETFVIWVICVMPKELGDRTELKSLCDLETFTGESLYS